MLANCTKCSANSASAALNKWLKSRAPSGCVVHSFRHSIRDRLSAVECPPDIADAIGGWSNPGVGKKYGSAKLLFAPVNELIMPLVTLTEELTSLLKGYPAT